LNLRVFSNFSRLKERLCLTVLGILIFSTFSYFLAGLGANQNSRYSEVISIVNFKTYQIDPFVKNTPDWSFYRGHYYSNKAPGGAYMAVPFYYLLLAIMQVSKHMIPHYVVVYLLNLFTAVLPALMMFLLFYLTCKEITGSLQKSFFMVAVMAFGTLLFPFSTIFMGHTTAAAFLASSFYLLILCTKKDYLRTYLFSAGLLAALSVLTEYTCILGVAFLFVYLLIRSRNRSRDGLIFILGGLGPLFLFMHYHYTCFGGPFTLPQKYINPLFVEPYTNKILGIFGMPDGTVMIKLLFSMDRGLFLFCPILIMVIPLLLFRFSRIAYKAEVIISVLIFVLFWLLNASFNGWDGGCSSGPRYLIPAIPFLAFPLIFMVMEDKYRFISYPLLIISVVNMLVVSCVNVMPCEEGGILLSYLYPHFLHGDFAINPNSWAFNLGTVIGLRGIYSILPLLSVAILLVFLIFYLLKLSGENISPKNRKNE